VIWPRLIAKYMLRCASLSLRLLNRREHPVAAARAAFEANYIAETLARHRNNVSHAAIALGVSRVTLQKKMKEYSLR